jgi:excinuclease ABC subunit C
VLTRRFEHGLKEIRENRTDGHFDRFPDIILMDGGRGQVNIALGVLESLDLHIPVCGMVKDDHHRTRGLYFNNEEIPIDKDCEAFKLLTRIQDEVHRFAIEYHRQLRSKGQVRSVLDEIEGIGPARRKALLRTFKTAERIRDASYEELLHAPSMNAKSAKSVYDFFHSADNGPVVTEEDRL